MVVQPASYVAETCRHVKGKRNHPSVGVCREPQHKHQVWVCRQVRADFQNASYYIRCVATPTFPWGASDIRVRPDKLRVAIRRISKASNQGRDSYRRNRSSHEWRC